MAVRFPRGAMTGLVGLAGGLVAGQALSPSRAEPQVPMPVAATATNPQEKRVLANLYMQTAAEYRACCLQTYKLATEKLLGRLRSLPTDGQPPAVVMDLDETVIDNSPFQEFLFRNRLVYRDELWVPWERDQADEVGLVPGAKAFIAAAEQAGVTVVYISNRVTQFRDSTVRALEHNGINVAGIDDRMYLRKEPSHDKTKRREAVGQRYRVLMTFGDNLRDFSEEFKVQPGVTTVGSRAKQVDETAAHWGSDWFILPNPSYGEWEKLLGDRPEARLRATTMRWPQP